MKKQLILALSFVALAFAGCKKSIEPINYGNLGNSDQMILLKTFGPTKVANEGVRDTLFLAGDQIGVTAAFTSVDTLHPDWTKTVFFDNAPACFNNYGDVIVPGYTDKRSYFAWGASGEGGLKWNRYYPAQNVAVMLYAYYPYTNDASYVPSDGTNAPKLNVELNTDTVRLTEVKGANVKQADILHFATVKGVSRKDTLSLMTFKHALAQLTFRFRREAGSSIAYVDTIEFCTAKKGALNITTGRFDYAVDADSVDAKYTIIPKNESKYRQVPLYASNDAEYMLDIFAAASANPLMILPLEVAMAQKGTLRIVINVSTDGTKTGPEFQKSMTVPLRGISQPFSAGKKHVFNVLVTNSGINLEAKIEPWDPNGNSSNLETE